MKSDKEYKELMKEALENCRKYWAHRQKKAAESKTH